MVNVDVVQQILLCCLGKSPKKQQQGRWGGGLLPLLLLSLTLPTCPMRFFFTLARDDRRYAHIDYQKKVSKSKDAFTA